MKKIKTTFLLILLISIFSVGSVKASDVELKSSGKVHLFDVINNGTGAVTRIDVPIIKEKISGNIIAACIDPRKDFYDGKTYQLYDSLEPKESAVVASLLNNNKITIKEKLFAIMLYVTISGKNNSSYIYMPNDMNKKVYLKDILTEFYNTNSDTYNKNMESARYSKIDKLFISLDGINADSIKNIIKEAKNNSFLFSSKSFPTIEKYSKGTKYNENDKIYTVALKINNLDYVRELYALNNSGSDKSFNEKSIFTNKDAYEFSGNFSKKNLKEIRFENDIIYFDFNSNTSCLSGTIKMGIGFQYELGLVYKVASSGKQTFIAYANPFKGSYDFYCTEVKTYNQCEVAEIKNKDQCLHWRKKLVQNSFKETYDVRYNCDKWDYASTANTYSLYDGKDLVTRSFIENQGMPFNYYIFAPQTETIHGADCCATYDNDPTFREALKYFGLTDAQIDDGYNRYCSGTPSTCCNYDSSTSTVNNSLLTTPFKGPTQFKTAEYAFTKLGCCDDYKNKINGFASVFNNSDWKEAYDKYCNGTPPENPNCVDPAPTKGTSKISNCCMDDTHSYIAEIQVTDLFKEDANKYGVNGTELKEKCDNSKLEVSKEDVNDYCELYCTERIEVDVPGAITADSGRYFKLNAVEGTEFRSPVIDGYRRCRVVVKYDKFESDYKAKVKELVNQYNQYQLNKDIYEKYTKATKSGDGSGEKVGECSGYDNNGQNGHRTEADVTWDMYHVDSANTPQLEVVDNGQGNAVTIRNTQPHIFSGDDYADNVTDKNSRRGGCNKGDASHGADVPHGSRESEFKNAMDTAKSNYDNLLNEIKKMEDKLNKCDNYFAETNYKLEPTMSFVYTQFYMDESGNPQSVDNVVNFNTSCENSTSITDPTKSDSKDKIVGVGYATNTYNKTQTFNRLDENMNRTSYTADTKFRHDGIFNVKCHGEEEDKSYYTLIPSGSVSTVEEASNFTIHEREYKLLLTSYDGSYETHWDISGLGQKDDKNPDGRLNNFFNKPNEYIGYDTTITSCADKNADEEGTYTCVFNVTHKMITTGRCNPDSGLVTTNPDSCDPMREGYSLFYFKVVDPANLFPDGTSEYGKNWSNDMINKVQSADTYNPNNITYQFTLNPADMKNIKEYNDSKESIGGYSDFDLKCTCDKTACTSCMSEFINNIYNGYININGNEKSISKPENDINSVRSKMEW